MVNESFKAAIFAGAFLPGGPILPGLRYAYVIEIIQ
jgi:hypothetical protein